MSRARKFWPLLVIAPPLLVTYVFWTSERVLISEQRESDTFEAERRGFELREHRFRPITELVIWSDCDERQVKLRYIMGASRFDQIKVEWLRKNSVAVLNVRPIQEDSAQIPGEPTKIIYDYTLGRLYTTLRRVSGHVSQAELTQALKEIERADVPSKP